MLTTTTTISEASVLKATAKPWWHWFAVLDRLGNDVNHTARAAHLRTKHGVAPWWSQMVALQYERARGHRVPHQRADGVFEVNVQRTVPVGVEDAFDAWADAKRIGTWFSTKVVQDVRVGGTYRNGDGDRGTFLAVDPPRRLRFTWDNPEHAPGSIAEVAFLPTGRGSTAVRVTHTKLPSRKVVEGLRRGWTWALTSLRSYLATGKPIRYEVWRGKQKAERTRAPSSDEVPAGSRDARPSATRRTKRTTSTSAKTRRVSRRRARSSAAR